MLVKHANYTNNITIRGAKVEFCSELEHVGVIRNTGGNMPHIIERLAKHKKAMAALLVMVLQSPTKETLQHH